MAAVATDNVRNPFNGCGSRRGAAAKIWEQKSQVGLPHHGTGLVDIDKQERQPQVYTLEENLEVKFAYVTAYKA